MNPSEEQCQQIAKTLPRQRGNVGIENRALLDGLIFRCKTGCARKNGGQAIGRTRGGWNTKIHVVAASDTVNAGFLLSGGNEPDANAGRLLLETLDPQETTVDLAMDRAYSDGLTRMTAWSLRYNPIVPPKRNRKKPWAHDAEAYRKRNEVERFFRRIKTCRAVATRYDKLDLMFSAFIWLACICILLRSVNTP